MPQSPFSNVSPKAHGAWLGAGSGASVAAVIVGLIQDYWTHAALPAAAVQGIYIVVSAIAAFAGAYILPQKTGAQADADATARITTALGSMSRVSSTGTNPPSGSGSA